MDVLGRWGSNILGEASNATATASNWASKGSDVLRSGAKKASQSMSNVAPVGAKHTFDDPQGGTIVVKEVQFLAEGAFGAVSKARDANGTEYALKKIGCQEGVQIASSLKDAEREAAILLSLPLHENIIRCYASSTEQHCQGSATVKVLMELCPGGTLLDYMDSKDGKLGAKEVIQPFAQIVEGVRHLHAQKPGIQHRDLKVENVLMGNDGKWKLCDFGSCSTEITPPKELSRQKSMDLQEEIEKTVTMLYRPPEMADVDLNFRNGYEINTQVDIWMLGCILYTLTFYRHPFQDCPTANHNGKYFIPDDHPLGKSAKLCGIIHWLLALDPKDRPNCERILELLRDIGKCQYEDLFNMMPGSVQEKIKKLDALFEKRRDTGDMPLPPAAAALMAGRGGSSATPAAASSPGKSAQQKQQQQQQQQQRRPSNQAQEQPQRRTSNTSTPKSGGDDAFDIMSALAPASAPATNNRSSATQNKALVQQHQQEDLLGFGSPTPASAVAAPAAAASGFDLLGFGAPAPSAAANNNFADFTSAPAAALAVPPATGDWCDFANFASAPAPVASGGYNNITTPVATPTSSTSGAPVSGDLMGFDFADPLAPTAQSCSGAARAAAPAEKSSGSFNLLDLDF